jgi:hypothetical protein
MTLDEATAAAVNVRSLFEALETQRHGRAWNLPELALGRARGHRPSRENGWRCRS